MSEKKMVRRNVAIALGIICIVLVAGLAGALIYYTLAMGDRDNTIAIKDNQIASLNSQIADQNSTISSLNTQLAILKNQVSNIHILGTENSTVWVDNQTTNIGQGTGWEFEGVYSAGYVLVLVSSSNNSTYVQVINQISNSTIVGYDRKIQVGFDGTAVLPILPGRVFVEVGNSFGAGTITVTAIYCY